MAIKKATYRFDNGISFDEIMFKTTADQVVFEDGDTFQDKFDSGELTGPQGPSGSGTGGSGGGPIMQDDEPEGPYQVGRVWLDLIETTEPPVEPPVEPPTIVLPSGLSDPDRIGKAVIDGRYPIYKNYPTGVDSQPCIRVRCAPDYTKDMIFYEDTGLSSNLVSDDYPVTPGTYAGDEGINALYENYLYIFISRARLGLTANDNDEFSINTTVMDYFKNNPVEVYYEKSSGLMVQINNDPIYGFSSCSIEKSDISGFNIITTGTQQDQWSLALDALVVDVEPNTDYTFSYKCDIAGAQVWGNVNGAGNFLVEFQEPNTTPVYFNSGDYTRVNIYFAGYDATKTYRMYDVKVEKGIIEGPDTSGPAIADIILNPSPADINDNCTVAEDSITGGIKVNRISTSNQWWYTADDILIATLEPNRDYQFVYDADDPGVICRTVDYDTYEYLATDVKPNEIATFNSGSSTRMAFEFYGLTDYPEVRIYDYRLIDVTARSWRKRSVR